MTSTNIKSSGRPYEFSL